MSIKNIFDLIEQKQIQFYNGDNDAFAFLFQLWEKELFLFTYNFIKNREETEDVMYDCLEKILNSEIEYRLEKFILDGIQLKPFFKLVLKNRAIDLLKLKKNRNRIIQSLNDFFYKESLNESIVRESEDFLFHILKNYKTRDKDMILMHTQGYTLDEISQKYFLSKKTISNIITNIKQDLRLKFEKKL